MTFDRKTQITNDIPNDLKGLQEGLGQALMLEERSWLTTGIPVHLRGQVLTFDGKTWLTTGVL